MKQLKCFIVTGVSTSGKSSLVTDILSANPSEFYLSSSVTDREEKPRDKDSAKKYIYVSSKDFTDKIWSGYFLEWNPYGVHRYGTPSSVIVQALASKKHLLLEMDPVGTVKLLARKENKDATLANVDLIPIFIYRKFDPRQPVDFSDFDAFIRSQLEKREVKLLAEEKESRIGNAIQEYKEVFENKDKFIFIENKENNLLWMLNSFQSILKEKIA